MSYTTFKNVVDYGQTDFTQSLAMNLQNWIDWSFLSIGAFYNITIPTSGIYGGSQSQLRPVNDPYYSSGMVWEAFRSNWVYESGLRYGLYHNIVVSGVYINDNFYTPDDPIYSHTINYTLGRITFTNPIPLYSNVKCEYSFKAINVSNASVPWTRYIISDSMRVDNTQFNQYGSGVWDILSASRIQLPAVIVESNTNVSFQGYELGGGQKRLQDVSIYVIAETPWDRDNITDKLLMQNNKTIFLYNINDVSASGKFPLQFDGTLQIGGYEYPALVDENVGFRERRCIIKNPRSYQYDDNHNIYRSVIQITCEVLMPEA